MAETTVFLSKMAREVPAEKIERFLKMVEEQILQFTGLKNSVTLADSASSPHIIIAMRDMGNQGALTIVTMGAAIRMMTIAYFLQHSLILKPSDVSITISGTSDI